MQNEADRIKALQSKLSIIVPIFNEIELLPEVLAHLQQWQRKGCEVLLVDGESTDGSAEVAEAIGFTVLRASRSRAIQMNSGASRAKGSALVFLHVDTRLPADANRRILEALENHVWGRFDVQLSGNSLMLRVIAFLMNCRSRLTGIATGDQAIFVDGATFRDIGGFPEQPLMEDIEISRRLLQLERPACIRARAISSGRRWLNHGIWRTVWLMWRLRWAYWRGEPAERLANLYR